VRLSRCEVRDHINYRKNDRWRSYRFYRTLQRLKSPMRYICEIVGARDFRVFQHNLPNPDILGSRSRRQSRYRGALAAAGPVSDADASYQLAGSETANTVIRSSKVRHCASPVSPECQVECNGR
jgi:hypothetical protein